MRVAVFITLFTLLILLLIRLVIFAPQIHSYPDNVKLTLEATVNSAVRIKGNLQSFMLQPRDYEKVYVTTTSVPRIYYGQRLKIAGTLKKKVLDNDQVINSIYFPQITTSKEQGIFFVLRKRIIISFERYLPPDSARLLLGIAFGMKEPLSSELSDQVRVVGLLHVIAASGMNITLLTGALVAILGRFFSRRTTILVTLLSILFYATFAGFEPSIVRASIMGSLGLFAGLVGKQYFGLWALFLSGYLMLFIDPLLLSDVGFQLSFLATLGIIMLKPVLRFPLPALIKEDLTTTLSAQATTLPILLTTFGQFSLISVFVNVLLLWMIPFLMIIGGLAALISLLLEPLAGLLLYLCLPLLLLFEAVASFFAQLPGLIEVENIPVTAMIIYYLLLYGLIVYLSGRSQKKNE